MATTRHSSYITTIQTTLTTELNSLANAANSAASAEIDNSTGRNLYMDLCLVLATQGTARSNGATVVVYFVHALDGTTYDDVLNTTSELAAIFTLDAATTARTVTRRDIPLPPGKFKVFARNATGQALAASGNTIAYRMHNVETV